jgi:hypothetical protein
MATGRLGSDVDDRGARYEATLAWIRDRGVVLQSARGPVPNVAQFIAGEPIRGSWWGHPAGKEIYAILTLLDESTEIVSTRLINRKVTLLHARVWPGVVRVSEHLGPAHLGAIHSEHTSSGAHRTFEVDYPHWVPEAVLRDAARLSVDEAFALLPECLRTGA